MGKQRGGNMFTVANIFTMLFMIVLGGLILWGLVNWYMSTTNTGIKVLAVFLMVTTVGIALNGFLPDDD
jgi:hypothetical protein